MAMEVCRTNMNLNRMMVIAPTQFNIVFIGYNDIWLILQAPITIAWHI